MKKLIALLVALFWFTSSAYAQTQSGGGSGGGGGGTEFAEDSVHSDGANGTLSLGVRRDANSTLCDATGDYCPFQLDPNGNLKVNIIAGAGSGGTAMADDSAFTQGVSNLTPMGAMFDNASPDSVDENDVGVPRMSANRNLFVNIRDAAGNERGANVSASGLMVEIAAGSVSVTGTVTTSQASAATADYDTGAGTATQVMFGLGIPGSGGVKAGGSLTNPIVIQCANTAGSALEACGGSGAGDGVIIDGTSAGQADVINTNPASNDYGLVVRPIIPQLPSSIGQKTMAGSTSVVLSSDQTSVTVDTEFNAPITVQSGMTISTAPAIISATSCYNGVTWDPCVSSASTLDAEGQASCTATSSTVRAANGSRLRLKYMNISSTEVWVCNQAPCTTSIGMPLLNRDSDEVSDWSGIVTCITASGTATVAYKEW